MYARNYHSYTHLILAMGIVRKPTVWVFITSIHPGTHDISLPTCRASRCSCAAWRGTRARRTPRTWQRVLCTWPVVLHLAVPPPLSHSFRPIHVTISCLHVSLSHACTCNFFMPAVSFLSLFHASTCHSCHSFMHPLVRAGLAAFTRPPAAAYVGITSTFP